MGRLFLILALLGCEAEDKRYGKEGRVGAQSAPATATPTPDGETANQPTPSSEPPPSTPNPPSPSKVPENNDSRSDSPESSPTTPEGEDAPLCHYENKEAVVFTSKDQAACDENAQLIGLEQPDDSNETPEVTCVFKYGVTTYGAVTREGCGRIEETFGIEFEFPEITLEDGETSRRETRCFFDDNGTIYRGNSEEECRELEERLGF